MNILTNKSQLFFKLGFKQAAALQQPVKIMGFAQMRGVKALEDRQEDKQKKAF